MAPDLSCVSCRRPHSVGLLLRHPLLCSPLLCGTCKWHLTPPVHHAGVLPVWGSRRVILCSARRYCTAPANGSFQRRLPFAAGPCINAAVAGAFRTAAVRPRVGRSCLPELALGACCDSPGAGLKTPRLSSQHLNCFLVTWTSCHA